MGCKLSSIWLLGLLLRSLWDSLSDHLSLLGFKDSIAGTHSSSIPTLVGVASWLPSQELLSLLNILPGAFTCSKSLSDTFQGRCSVFPCICSILKQRLTRGAPAVPSKMPPLVLLLSVISSSLFKIIFISFKGTWIRLSWPSLSHTYYFIIFSSTSFGLILLFLFQFRKMNVLTH